MADVLAVAGLAYPIAKDLLKLAKKLARLHMQIRNAKTDLTNVIKRTTSVARTYDFFRDTMKVARKIQELASMFNRHQQLMRSINEESRRTIRTLKHITSKFRSLIGGEPISTVDRWIAQFEWSRVSKKTVPSLFQDMKVLERSMRTIGTLVHIQLLSHIHQRDGSDVVVAQLESFRKMLDIEFDKLQQAQRVQKTLTMQHQTSASQHLEARDFAQKIVQILEKEIPRLKIYQPVEGRSASDLRSPPTSPISNKPPPITARSPSTPSTSGSQTSASKRQQHEDVSLPRKQILRQRSTQSAPSRIPSRSSPPSLYLSDGGSDSHDCQGAKSEMPYQNASQDQGGAYMQMPPFGPPKLVSRTSIRRPSPERPDSSNDTFDQQHAMHRGGSHPPRRRRNNSKISEYGDGGEVTATHKTGSIGLPSRRWKGKSRPDQ